MRSLRPIDALMLTRGCATGPALRVRGAAPRDARGRVLVLGTVRGDAVVLVPLDLHTKVAHL